MCGLYRTQFEQAANPVLINFAGQRSRELGR
jgi:hypothetical protein